MSPGMVPGASDYVRWDAMQAKSINGDLGSTLAYGTSPPSVVISGVPIAALESVEIDITAGGNPGTFSWSYNGVVQATGVSTSLGTYALTSVGVTTGLVATFPSATYSSDNRYVYGPWNPTSPVVVGGSGLVLHGGSIIRGGVRTRTGGRIVMSASTNEVPQLSPARTRTIVLSAIDLRVDGGVGLTDNSILGGPTGTLIVSSSAEVSIPSRYLQHNGTWQLLSVVATFVIPTKPATSLTSPMTMTFVALTSTGAVASAPFIPLSHIVGTWSGPATWTAGQYITAFNNAPSLAGIFKCSVGGTTVSSVEPTWNTTVGGTTNDTAGVKWETIGGDGGIVYAPNTPDEAYNGGQPQTVRIDFDPAQNCTLDLANNRHLVKFTSIPVPTVLLSLAFTFGGCTSMAFE